MAQIYNVAAIDEVLKEKGFFQGSNGKLYADTMVNSGIGFWFGAIGASVAAANNQNKTKYVLGYNDKIIKVASFDGITGEVQDIKVYSFAEMTKLAIDYSNRFLIKRGKEKFYCSIFTKFQGINQKEEIAKFKSLIKTKKAEIKARKKTK